MGRKDHSPPTMLDELDRALDALRGAWSRASSAELLPFREQVMRLGKEIAALEAEVITAMKAREQRSAGSGG